MSLGITVSVAKLAAGSGSGSSGGGGGLGNGRLALQVEVPGFRPSERSALEAAVLAMGRGGAVDKFSREQVELFCLDNRYVYVSFSVNLFFQAN